MAGNTQKQVLVRVCKITKGPKEDEKTDFVTQGDFYRKDGAYYIVYKESELTGLNGTTTYIKSKDREITISRFGTLESKLKFKEGEKNFSPYKTQYGTFNVSLFTNELEDKLKDNGGFVKIFYNIEIEGLMDAQNVEMTINVREINGN